jgi:hypothetical protein
MIILPAACEFFTQCYDIINITAQAKAFVIKISRKREFGEVYTPAHFLFPAISIQG